jgi:trk system potassium uptake protein TrkA
MNIIVVGCGRLGIELALSLQQNHVVTVIDKNAKAFDQLGLNFLGRTVQGEGLDQGVLKRAGIETADGLAAVTSSDNVNAIVARVAQDVFQVRHVVARLYNPRRAQVYAKLNLQTIAPSVWGAQQIERLLVEEANAEKE